MKLDIGFVQSGQSFSSNFSEGNTTFNSNFGGYVEIPTSVSSVRISEVTLRASAWKKVEDNLYSQVSRIDGVTKKSQVDLTPNVEQLIVFYEKDLSFVTENDGGIVTIYAIGQKPTNDYTIQVTITEVDV